MRPRKGPLGDQLIGKCHILGHALQCRIREVQPFGAAVSLQPAVLIARSHQRLLRHPCLRLDFLEALIVPGKQADECERQQHETKAQSAGMHFAMAAEVDSKRMTTHAVPSSPATAARMLTWWGLSDADH